MDLGESSDIQKPRTYKVTIRIVKGKSEDSQTTLFDKLVDALDFINQMWNHHYNSYTIGYWNDVLTSKGKNGWKMERVVTYQKIGEPDEDGLKAFGIITHAVYCNMEC